MEKRPLPDLGQNLSQRKRYYAHAKSKGQTIVAHQGLQTFVRIELQNWLVSEASIPLAVTIICRLAYYAGYASGGP